ncbi:MAG: tetraacyldisaccharide 4'-kinase [Sulfurimonas sp.]
MQLSVFIEAMYFAPKWYHYPLIVLLLPLSMIYGVLMYLRRRFTAKKSYGIPMISVGNLVIGGSGKTPFTIALALEYDGVAVISRGYGRKSSGLVEVSRNGKILTDVQKSGDEPMLMARSLPNASVIVSEDRHRAIELARENGARLIILDDGFNRVEIEKFEIILEPASIKNYLPFPSGPFREFWFTEKYADIVAKEGRDFSREVEVKNIKPKMLLITAISNPQRLDPYLPEGVVRKIYLPDHEYFDEAKVGKIFAEYGADSILCTSKDRVKMEGFTLPISELKLKLNIEDGIIGKIQAYIQSKSEK